jgi:hypothetical protein
MSPETQPVQRVTRAAMWLGATLAVGACTKEPDTLPVTVTPTNTPSTVTNTNGPTQLLPTTVTNNGVTPQGTLFPQPQLVPQQPADPHITAVPAYGAPAPQVNVNAPPSGPNDPGSHARRYGAPAFVPWDEEV